MKWIFVGLVFVTKVFASGYDLGSYDGVYHSLQYMSDESVSIAPEPGEDASLAQSEHHSSETKKIEKELAKLSGDIDSVLKDVIKIGKISLVPLKKVNDTIIDPFIVIGKHKITRKKIYRLYRQYRTDYLNGISYNQFDLTNHKKKLGRKLTVKDVSKILRAKDITKVIHFGRGTYIFTKSLKKKKLPIAVLAEKPDARKMIEEHWAVKIKYKNINEKTKKHKDIARYKLMSKLLYKLWKKSKDPKYLDKALKKKAGLLVIPISTQKKDSKLELASIGSDQTYGYKLYLYVDKRVEFNTLKAIHNSVRNIIRKKSKLENTMDFSPDEEEDSFEDELLI